jgi:hypothetical protein
MKMKFNNYRNDMIDELEQMGFCIDDLQDMDTVDLEYYFEKYSR